MACGAHPSQSPKPRRLSSEISRFISLASSRKARSFPANTFPSRVRTCDSAVLKARLRPIACGMGPEAGPRCPGACEAGPGAGPPGPAPGPTGSLAPDAGISRVVCSRNEVRATSTSPRRRSRRSDDDSVATALLLGAGELERPAVDTRLTYGEIRCHPHYYVDRGLLELAPAPAGGGHQVYLGEPRRNVTRDHRGE